MKNQMTTNEKTDYSHRLEAIGFGPSRSVNMAYKADPSLLEKLVSFADEAKENSYKFRVFQSSGSDGYHANLRLMLITGKKANAYTDSRGWLGSIEQVEVGYSSITHAQLAAIGNAIDALSEALPA